MKPTNIGSWFITLSAALVGSTFVMAEPEIIESQPDVINEPEVKVVQVPVNNSQGMAELLFQQQQMQQEMMDLRGQVEELLFQIQQLKRESKDRYIDLDRRISESVQGVNQTPSPSTSTSEQTATGSNTQVVVVDQAAERTEYNQAKNLIRDKKYAESIEAFKDFIADYPESSYVPNAWYWMGEVYLVLREFDNGKAAFLKIYRDYPEHQKIADATFKLGIAHNAVGDKERSRQYLQEVVENYKDTQTARRAQAALDKMNQ